MAFGPNDKEYFTTRTGSTLVYILADHLDSTRGTVNASGGALATISYWPFGAVRSGWVGTDKQYTGQQKEFVSTLGAYYYNARFYSTALGTFMSADTLTTDGLNRYAYVRGNPLRYNDPSGHGVTGGGGLNEGYCPATNPACFHDGSGPVGGTGKPAPVVDRCDAVCRALKALYHAGLTSPELVQQAARAGAAATVRTSDNGGLGGPHGWGECVAGDPVCNAGGSNASPECAMWGRNCTPEQVGSYPGCQGGATCAVVEGVPKAAVWLTTRSSECYARIAIGVAVVAVTFVGAPPLPLAARVAFTVGAVGASEYAPYFEPTEILAACSD